MKEFQQRTDVREVEINEYSLMFSSTLNYISMVEEYRKNGMSPKLESWLKHAGKQYDSCKKLINGKDNNYESNTAL